MMLKVFAVLGRLFVKLARLHAEHRTSKSSALLDDAAGHWNNLIGLTHLKQSVY